MWAFYPPVLFYVIWLGLKYRSLLLFTAANPGIPAGGVVGESKWDILRALSYAKRNKQDPGDAGDKAGPDTTETTGTGNDGPGVDPDKDDPPGKDTTPEVDTSGPSAVPLPLIVLAGLALLLLAAGGAGYLNRRAETRRIDGPDDLDD